MAHCRTFIQRVEIRNFRSIEHLVLEDLPEMVVFHGPNGSGKSNVMRAIRLALRAAARQKLPHQREDGWLLSAKDADQQFRLRPEDFRRGATPEIYISLRIEIGSDALRVLAIEGQQPFGLRLDFCSQLVGQEQMRIWFPLMEDSGGFGLWGTDHQGTNGQKRRQRVAQIESRLGIPWLQALRDIDRLQQVDRTEVHSIMKLESHIKNSSLLSERLRLSLIKEGLLLTSDASRRIEREPSQLSEHSLPGLQARFVQASLSEYQEEAQSIDRLGRALGKVKLFGDSTPKRVQLRPVKSKVFQEDRLMVQVPGQGEVPVQQLGSGQQQIVLLMAWQVLGACPIRSIEEPESHLHWRLMETLADYLRASVESKDGAPPEVDQLWLETHHHAFALWPTYFDVSLVDGKTVVEKKPRTEAAPKHFYEPGPFWDALKELLQNGVQEGDVIFVDQQGEPVTAGALRKAIDSEILKDDKSYRLAREFVKFANQTLVASLQRDPEAPDALPAALPAWRRCDQPGLPECGHLRGEAAR